jgi:hypothetical protein
LSRLPDMFNLGAARMEFGNQHCSIQRWNDQPITGVTC